MSLVERYTIFGGPFNRIKNRSTNTFRDEGLIPTTDSIDTSISDNVAQEKNDVNSKYERNQERGTISSVDSDGNKLSKGQKEYFKDSKVVDENGKLKLVIRGDKEYRNIFKSEYRGAIWFTVERYTIFGGSFNKKWKVAKRYNTNKKHHKGHNDLIWGKPKVSIPS